MPTTIEYVDESINPITTTEGGWFCVKSSAGCKNCYSEKLNLRFGNKRYYSSHQGSTNPPEFLLNRNVLNKIKRWTKPKRIFLQSMSDLFLPGYDYMHDRGLKRSWFEGLRQIWLQIRHYHQHKFLILTKHPDRLLEFYNWIINKYPDYGFNYDNLWLGVSCENQEQADKRIPILLQIPAAVRFVSVEPILGPISLMDVVDHAHEGVIVDALNRWCWEIGASSHEIPFGLDWVIIGVESGPKARKIENHHILHLIQQCSSAKIPVFLKQIWVKGKIKTTLEKLPVLGGQVWDQMPKR